MPKNLRRSLLSMAVLLSGIAIWLCYLLATPSPNLLTRAVKVARVQDFVGYDWLSSDRLLVKTDTNGYPYRTWPWSGRLDLIDAQTHKSTPLTGLLAVIALHLRHYNYMGPLGFTLSPDGKWLLWTRQDPTDGGSYPVTARLDGSGYREWPMSSDAHNYWIGANRCWIDGHRWISSSFDFRDRQKGKYVILHDAAGPSADRRLAVESVETQALFKKAGISWRNDSGGISLGGDCSQVSGSMARVTVLVRPAGSPPGTPLKPIDTLTFPGKTHFYNVLPNRQMTKLEILVSETSAPAFLAWIGRLFPPYSYLTHPVERLYVYRFDTKACYEIGWIEEASTTGPEIINAFWLPDGKHIQFYYRNAVYIVSSDYLQPRGIR